MKRSLYKVILALTNSSGDVCFAVCTCPAGLGIGGFGNWNHVGGILFRLEDFNRRGLQDFTTTVSCTSKLSSWNVPGANSLPIDEIIFQKIKFGKNNERGKIPRYNCYDPRARDDRCVDKESIATLRAELSECIPNSSFFCFYDVSLLAPEVSDQQNQLPLPREHVAEEHTMEYLLQILIYYLLLSFLHLMNIITNQASLLKKWWTFIAIKCH